MQSQQQTTPSNPHCDEPPELNADEDIEPLKQPPTFYVILMVLNRKQSFEVKEMDDEVNGAIFRT